MGVLGEVGDQAGDEVPVRLLRRRGGRRGRATPWGAELVGAGGSDGAEPGVGAEGGGAVEPGAVGAPVAVRAEEGVAGRGVVGGEGEACPRAPPMAAQRSGVLDAVRPGDCGGVRCVRGRPGWGCPRSAERGPQDARESAAPAASAASRTG